MTDSNRAFPAGAGRAGGPSDLSRDASQAEPLVPNAYELLDNPEGQAAFMLPKLNDAQRQFIVRMRPTRTNQRISKRDFDAVWPGVETGEEWPWQFWFGGTRSNYPAGRSPLGKKRCSYGFCFNEAGLLIRERLNALAAGTQRAETRETAAQSEGCQSGGDQPQRTNPKSIVEGN